ncbi:hypothetical protein CISIN_1g0349132mg [Citrus sinensis]|uniref:Uncharacterized protein n=1 Tax=Citrus sinensis TaxID=2711 RepID=A0A067F0K1_CITSI|nr:hypothetical protein CISIN_1g0349132mg [Citrus sinensis]
MRQKNLLRKRRITFVPFLGWRISDKYTFKSPGIEFALVGLFIMDKQCSAEYLWGQRVEKIYIWKMIKKDTQRSSELKCF